MRVKRARTVFFAEARGTTTRRTRERRTATTTTPRTATRTLASASPERTCGLDGPHLTRSSSSPCAPAYGEVCQGAGVRVEPRDAAASARRHPPFQEYVPQDGSRREHP